MEKRKSGQTGIRGTMKLKENTSVSTDLKTILGIVTGVAVGVWAYFGIVEKLNKPIGTEGAIFRDTAVENVIEGLRRAKALNVNADQDVDDMADHLLQAIDAYNFNKDALRESPIVREQAAIKLDAIAKKMAAYGLG